MRIIRAFQTDDGVVHISPEDAARHDFRREMLEVFRVDPTIEELSVNLDTLQRILNKAKNRDVSVLTSAANG